MARLEASGFSVEELSSFIETLAAHRGEDEDNRGRFDKLHSLIKVRDDHFYNAPDADQILPKPHHTVEPYQTDILRRTWVEGKGRMVENPFKIRVVPPKDTPEQNREANNFETVLQRGVELVQERQGINIQADLADGQWVHCYGVLHWQKATDIWPRFEMIEGEDPADALERNRHEKARAGFPFYIEVIRSDQFAFIEDRSVVNGMALALVLRTTPLIEYNRKLRDRDQLVLSINEVNNDILIFEEKDAPSKDDPSWNEYWGREIEIAHVWTRTEFYELARSTGPQSGKWTLVKSFRHPYEMPPFAVAGADEVNHPDPARRFLPAMEGLYRIKPFYDKDVTLGRAIAEQIALPFYWIKLADGTYMQNEDGTRIVLSRNALSAQALPAGATLEKVEFEMNPAFLEFLRLTGEEMTESAPDTGFVEVGASTQPWTIRLAQDQANTLVKELKLKQARALRTMFRNFALVMSKPADEGGIGQTVYVYAKTRAGKVLKDQAIGVEPDTIPTLEIEVDIDPFSSAQTISNIEHMRTWLADPNVPFTKRDFLEQAFRDDNPEETIEVWEADRIWEERIKPGVVEQELAKAFGDSFIVSPGLDFVGIGGEQAQPEEVLAANGVRAQSSNGANGGAPGVPGAAQAESSGMNDLLPLQAPGTDTLPGQPG